MQIKSILPKRIFQSSTRRLGAGTAAAAPLQRPYSPAGERRPPPHLEPAPPEARPAGRWQEAGRQVEKVPLVQLALAAAPPQQGRNPAEGQRRKPACCAKPAAKPGAANAATGVCRCGVGSCIFQLLIAIILHSAWRQQWVRLPLHRRDVEQFGRLFSRSFAKSQHDLHHIISTNFSLECHRRWSVTDKLLPCRDLRRRRSALVAAPHAQPSFWCFVNSID